MEQLIMDKMFAALGNAWPDITLYQEHVPQGFEVPCFYIKAMEAKHVGGLGYRAKRDYPFVVHYFAQSDMDRRRECVSVGERLIDVLEYIKGEVAEYRRGFDISYEVTDENVCLFKITYRAMVEREHEEVKMQELKHNEVVPDETGKFEDPSDGTGCNPGLCKECGAVFCARIGKIGSISGG